MKVIAFEGFTSGKAIALHADGCGDMVKLSPIRYVNRRTRMMEAPIASFPSLEAAMHEYTVDIDEDFGAPAYDESDIKVYACCKRNK